MKTSLPIARYILILVVVWFLASALEPIIFHLYKLVYPIEPVGTFGDLDLTQATVFIYSYIFCFPVLGILFGDANRYKVVGVFLALALVLNALGDSSHILFWPLVLFSGPILGYGLRFTISNSLGKLPQFAQYKKFF